MTDAMPWIISAVLGIATIVVSWLGVRNARQSNSDAQRSAEAARVLTAWKDLVDPLRLELKELRIALEEAKLALEDALARILELEKREAYLDGKVHEKDEQIEQLREELATARFNEQRLRQQLERHRLRITALERHYQQNGHPLPPDLPAVED